jgi:tripartite-type tricarboxylate transporter receptor subunit TctC
MPIVRILLALATCLASAVNAQQYPSKPIRLVIPQGAGGPSDLFGRMLAEHLARNLGQTILPENRPGDGSMLSHRYAAQQAPDGYTLLLTGDYTQLWPVAAKSWDLDLLKDFTYIGTAIRADSLLLVPATSPHKTFGEFMAFARANPGKTNYPHISVSRVTIVMRYINKRFGLGMTEIPYKSSAEAKLATLRGEVSFYFDSPATARDKATHPLLFITSQRYPLFPEIPTLSDAELASLGLALGSSWVGMAGPPNMPADVLGKISAALRTTVDSREFNERATSMGFVTMYTTPAELRAKMAEESAVWAKIAKEIGLTRE